jgi:chromosome segregation ATPase
METRSPDIRATIRDEERRRREEVLAQSLQHQLDELRHALREQTTRQQRQEEILRQTEAQLGQMRVDLDEARQEAHRAGQVRQLDEQRIRQQLTDLLSRVDEPQRPLRTLQAQVADLLDQVRQRRDHESQESRQLEALRLQIEASRSEIVRALEGVRQVRETIEALQGAQAGLGRDIQRLTDQGRLIEQEVRRRITEVEQQVTNLGTRIEEVAVYRPMLEEAIRRTREDMRVFQPQIDSLGQRADQQDHHLGRVQAQAEERDALMRDRLDVVRVELTTQIGVVAGMVETTAAHLHERMGEWEAAHRDLASRLGDVAMHTSTLERADEHLLEIMRRMEERLVRDRLDQAQQAWEALMDRRQRESESEG